MSIAAAEWGPDKHPLDALLISGGDHRLILDPLTGANPYGCRPAPNPAIAAFGSSTASTISGHAYQAVLRLEQQLRRDYGNADGPRCAREAFDRMRAELIELFGLEQVGPDIVFTASGTDAHLLAAELVGSEGTGELTVVAPQSSETGSGVPTALGRRNFSALTARGARVDAGAPLAGAAEAQIHSIALRHPDGAARPTDLIDAEAEALVAAAATAGRRVLLVVADVTKTGIIAPSPACAKRLQESLPGQVQVLVDACQLRLSPESLRTYLRAGFLVAATGSKFLTGPAFSGALLVPKTLTQRLSRVAVSADLARYSGAAEWPAGWAAASALPQASNVGLLLRWEAALSELRRFRSVATAEVAEFFRQFAAAVQDRLADDPVFDPLPVAANPERGGIEQAWERTPTIFPLRIRHSAPRTFRAAFSMAECARVHALLRQDLSRELSNIDTGGLHVEFGQPVACGERDSVQTGALRVCASARLASQVILDDGGDPGWIIAQAMRAIDKAALIARGLSRGDL